jgi:ComF family protein
VRAWKERGLRHLSACAADLVAEHVDRPAVDVITYVPADAVRQLRRGSHPAEMLACELASRWALDIVSVLGRTRAAERQAVLPYARRRANMRRVFTAEGSLGGARVLLVDDVYTTGSTVGAAASALRRQGARTVEVVTLARALRR